MEGRMIQKTMGGEVYVGKDNTEDNGRGSVCREG